jgi:HK97 family phage major capsid protein
MYALKLRQELGRLSDQMMQIVNKAKKEGNRGLTSAERESFDAMSDSYSSVEASIKRAERAESISNTLSRVDHAGGIGAADLEEIQDTFRLTPAQLRARERERDPHARAFSNYLRRGVENLDSAEREIMASQFVSNGGAGIRNAQSTTTSQGGYLIPQGFSFMLEEAMKWFGGIEGTVEKFTTEIGNPLPWPTVNDTTNKGRIIGQNVQVSETDIVFGQVTFNAYIGCSDLVLVPLALVEDSAFDIDMLVARLLGIRLGRLYNWKCTVGSGSGEPNGIVTAAVAAGNVNTFPAGETTTMAYTDLVNMEHAVDPAYRSNPSSYWMFNDAVLKGLKKLVDGNNRPLWQPGLTASFSQGAGVNITPGKPTILDHPYVINADMATPAANSYSILFGDLSTFKVRELKSGTTVLRLVERYADYLQLGIIAFRRFDSQLIDSGTHPVCVGQQSAT